jgi:hypothetical protein
MACVYWKTIHTSFCLGDATKPIDLHIHAVVAQPVERLTVNQQVSGSNPDDGAIILKMCKMENILNVGEKVLFCN